MDSGGLFSTFCIEAILGCGKGFDGFEESKGCGPLLS